MAYKISVTVQNPVTGESREIKVQIDPANFTATAWARGFPGVKAKFDELVAAAATSEPAQL